VLSGAAQPPDWPQARTGETTVYQPAPVASVREAYAEARSSLYSA
jgi:hypothetical protein